MENINMKKNKIILIVALVLSLSANADNDEMRFKAGQQNFKFGNNASKDKVKIKGTLPFYFLF
jgi:hypothetical protein